MKEKEEVKNEKRKRSRRRCSKKGLEEVRINVRLSCGCSAPASTMLMMMMVPYAPSVWVRGVSIHSSSGREMTYSWMRDRWLLGRLEMASSGFSSNTNTTTSCHETTLILATLHTTHVPQLNQSLSHLLWPWRNTRMPSHISSAS